MNVKLKQYISEAVCVSVIRREAPNLLEAFDHAIVSCRVTKQLDLRSLTGYVLIAWRRKQNGLQKRSALVFIFLLQDGKMYKRRKFYLYRGADKSLARPTYRCILFDGENIYLDPSLVIYIKSTNISSILIIINRIYETQNLLSL